MIKGILKAAMLLLVIVAFMSTSNSFAGPNGKITGVVKDKSTGEVLPGVNVMLDGTTMGAATNQKGEFSIINVPAGVYTLKASMIGYSKQTKSNVRVLPDFTTRTDFDLKEEELSGEEVVIVAERPMIQKDQTMTMTVTSSEEIKNLPVRGFQAVASLGAGIVVNNTRNLEGGTGNVNIRGGRPNETGVYIDGFQQNNLLTGVASAAIPNGAVEELIVITGGFDAEYGRNQSGIIQVTTKTGGTKYNGYMEWLGDPGGLGIAESYGYNTLSGGIGGPLIPGNNRIKFYVSAEGRNIDDAEPSIWGNPMYTLQTSTAKQNRITDLIGNTLKLYPADYDSNLVRDSLFFWNNTIAPDTVIWKKDKHGNIKYKKGARPNNSQGYGINSDRGFTVQSKISIDALANRLRFDIAGNYGKTWRRSTTMFRVLNNDANLRREIANYNAGLTATYTINSQSYFDIGANYFLNDRKLMSDKYEWNLGQYIGRDIGANGSRSYKGGNILFDINRGVLNFREDNASYVALKGNYLNQIDNHNQFKFGFDFFRHTVRFLNVRNTDDPVTGVNDYVGYTVVKTGNDVKIVEVNSDDLDNKILGAAHPYSASAYLQDKLEFEGLVVRTGLRYDLFNSGTKRIKDFRDPTGQDDPAQQGVLNPRTGKVQAGTLGSEDYENAVNDHKFSPRLSVSFPVSEKTQFRFSYGIFFQQPNLANLYVGPYILQRQSINGGLATAIGNPNLKAEETIEYEVGMRRVLSDNFIFDITAYYKDISNLVQLINYDSRPNALMLQRNEDEGVVQGINIAFELRRTHKISGRLAYTLQSARGSGSGEGTGFNSAWLGFQDTKFNSPLAFDQRHTFNASIDIRNTKNQGPEIGGMHPLENAGVNVMFNLGSGLPYTPTTISAVAVSGVPAFKPIGRRNSANQPWTNRIDLKADKFFDITNSINCSVYIQVLNVLNTENVTTVFTATGRADDDGFLNSSLNNLNQIQQDCYKVQMKDGFNWDTPRQARLGVTLNF